MSDSRTWLDRLDDWLAIHLPTQAVAEYPAAYRAEVGEASRNAAEFHDHYFGSTEKGMAKADAIDAAEYSIDYPYEAWRAEDGRGADEQHQHDLDTLGHADDDTDVDVQ